MKIHRLLVEQAVSAIGEIFSERWHADKVIERHLKQNRAWGARDRRFFAESVYGVVRHWRYLWFLKGEEPRLDNKTLLEIWAIFWRMEKGEWPEYDIHHLDKGNIENRLKKQASPEIATSMPTWLFNRIETDRPGLGFEICKSLNRPANVYLRTNAIKATPEQVRARLGEEGILTDLVGGEFPLALKLRERKNVFITKAFKDGLFEVQDLSSQLVARYLDPQPGDRVVDACAGAGGKSLHIAALMKNKGKIICLDIYDRKLKELKVRAARNGVDIIEARLIENQKTIKRLSCDRLLLDVPCSGTGVLRRNPDTKWKFKEEDLPPLLSLQQELLDNYSAMLKPGGRLVYSTCSALKSENESQVAEFLKTHPEYELIEKRFLDPSKGDWDGFFIARFKKLS